MIGIHASLRLRLALWYTGALVLVLVAFGALAFLIFVRSLDAQIDRLLVASTNALVQAFAAEQEEMTAETNADEEVAREARDFQFQDILFVIYDQNGRLVFAPERLSARLKSNGTTGRWPSDDEPYGMVYLDDGVVAHLPTSGDFSRSALQDRGAPFFAQPPKGARATRHGLRRRGSRGVALGWIERTRDRASRPRSRSRDERTSGAHWRHQLK